MRTPFGQECRYYYQDFHRGRATQECRLVEQSPASEAWQADLCRDCPAPGIVRANGCRHMRLEGRVVKGFLGFGRRMLVTARCDRSGGMVAEPHIGCGQCRLDSPAASIFGQE
ncbi:MAG TPA: hypothetical protein VJ754_06635 [Anaerolineae bacterium]|nr:hypothetical protein [Anaerolineae bacterium]